MNEIKSIEIAIQAAEVRLRQSLKRSDASPFIAHHQIEDDLFSRASKNLQFFLRGKPDELIRAFKKWPALSSAVLARALHNNYGDEGSSKIYEHIEKAFGLRSEFTNTLRHKLNAVFRQSCVRLGLSIPHEAERGDKLVEDYIAQAGVSTSQLDHLAQAFLRAERYMGMPPVESTYGLNSWEDDAIQYLHPSLTRIRKILEHDEAGYHAGLYTKLRSGENPGNSVEKEFSKSIKKATENLGSPPPGKDAVRPKFVFRDGDLFLESPAEALGGMVTVGSSKRLLGRGESIALPLPWPSQIPWEHSGLSDKSASEEGALQLLSRESELFIFDADSGRLLSKLTLAEPQPTVAAGEAAIISRVPFEIDGEEAFELGEGCYGIYADIKEGSIISSTYGRIALKAVHKPKIILEGNRIARSGGFWWIAGKTRVLVSCSPEIAKQGLELIFRHPVLPNPVKESVCHDADGNIFATLPNKLHVNGEFGALRVELRLADSSRALIKEKYWYWPGLKELSRGMVFDAVSIPSNWDEEISQHVSVDSSGRLILDEPTIEPYRMAVIGFKCEERPVRFSLQPPGVTVVLRTGEGSERLVKAGQSLAISPEEHALLLIRTASFHDGLDILGRIEKDAFDRFGVRRLLPGVLVSGGRHDRVDLLPDGRIEDACNLFKITPIAEPAEFQVSSRKDALDIKACFRIPVRALQVVRHGLISDEEATEEHVPNLDSDGICKVEWPDMESGRLTVRCRNDGIHKDLYLLDFRVCGSDRVWKRPVNLRKDCYKTAFFTLPVADPKVLLAMPEGFDIFLRISQCLMECYSEESWKSIERVVLPLWTGMARLLSCDDKGLSCLLQASFLSIPEDASPTWIPIHHPIEAAPHLFESDAGNFKCLKDCDAIGADHLAALGKLAGSTGVRSSYEAAGVHDFFFFGFSNCQEVYRNPTTRLCHFDFDRYKEVISTIEDDPSGTFWNPKRRRLTLAHHSWCCARLAERLRVMDAAGVNPNRLPHAMQIAELAHRRTPEKCLSPPEFLTAEHALVERLPGFFSGLAKESRKKNSASFWKQILPETKLDVKKALRHAGFLIRLAPELFAFYLLLWEIERRSHT